MGTKEREYRFEFLAYLKEERDRFRAMSKKSASMSDTGRRLATKTNQFLNELRAIEYHKKV